MSKQLADIFADIVTTEQNRLMANAKKDRLIFELVESIQELLDVIVVQDEFNTVAVNKAIKAIAKTTGGNE